MLGQNAKIMTLRRGALTVNTTMGNSVAQNACNVGKLRKPNLDMHGICTEKFRLTAESFTQNYPKWVKGYIELKNMLCIIMEY